MGSKVSACLYIDRQVLETAKRVGLNVSKVSENALMRAMEKLEDRGPETGLNRPSGVEGRGRDSNPGARLHRQGDIERLISDFFDFCRVDLGLSEATSKEYRRKMRRFFQALDKPVSSVTAEEVRQLAEAGFECVAEMEGARVFRKRK